MLQPLQLEQVSVRYTDDIAELRDFFEKAGLSLNMPESFGTVAAHVRSDRAFVRDLTSHLRVILHSRGNELSYADLLGIVAVAVAGTKFAAMAQEVDAHDLLGFLMDTRAAFGAPAASRPERPVVIPLVPLRAPEADAAPSFARQVEPVVESSPSFELPPEEDDSRRRIFWLAAVAACVLLIACGWFFHSASTGHGAPITASNDVPSAPVVADAEKQTVPSTQRPTQTSLVHDGVSHPLSHAAVSVPRPTKPSAAVPLSARASTAPSPTSNVARAASAETPSPSRGPHRTVPQPSVAMSVPVLRVPSLAAAAGNAAPTEGAVRRATVRSTSLGTMAANVLYSPSPAYPSAASSLHVQGEVKLEAEVDKTGNVVSTRVISGPPLLQEAAVQAVQQWRYRPYLYNDKPIGMNATVVLDFQLP